MFGILAVLILCTGQMLKIFDLMFSTLFGRFAVLACAVILLIGVVVLSDVMPAQVGVSTLATVILILVQMCLSTISRHRAGLADRTCELLPLFQRASDLSFFIFVLPARFFAAPACARPRLPSPGTKIRSIPHRPGAPSVAPALTQH